MTMQQYFTKYKENKEILDDTGSVARLLWERGWAEMTAGNISVRLRDCIKPGMLKRARRIPLDTAIPELKGSCFYVTGTGRRMRDVAQDLLANGVFLQFDKEGNAYFLLSPEGSIDPTSETETHLKIHQLIAQRGSGETAVLHAHATEVISLTHCPGLDSEVRFNELIRSIHPEAGLYIPQGVGLLPAIPDNNQSIADATRDSFRSHNLVIWPKHGAWSIGETVSNAFDLIDLVCKLAKIWFQAGRADQ
jgi:rhamnulose-1-phosphate aldolase